MGILREGGGGVAAVMEEVVAAELVGERDMEVRASRNTNRQNDFLTPRRW